MSSETYEILALKYAGVRRAQALRELHRRRRPRPAPPHRLFRLGDPQRQAHHRRRRGLRRGRGRQARPQDRAHAGRGPGADRRVGRQCRAVDRLRTCTTTMPARSAPSPRRASICRRPRWPTPPGLACATPTCAIPSPPTTCARWCRTSTRAGWCSTTATPRSRRASPCTRSAATAGACSACGLLTATGPVVLASDSVALLRELREGQGVPHHHRHRRRAGRLQARCKKLAASPRARGAGPRSAGAASAIPRSTARRRASCTGSTWPGWTAEQTLHGRATEVRKVNQGGEVNRCEPEQLGPILHIGAHIARKYGVIPWPPWHRTLAA